MRLFTHLHGSIRPDLEDLTTAELNSLSFEVYSELTRRGIRLEEGVESVLRTAHTGLAEAMRQRAVKGAEKMIVEAEMMMEQALSVLEKEKAQDNARASAVVEKELAISSERLSAP